MANTNAPFGLRPTRYLNGAPWNQQVRPYYVPADYGTALYIGDPVIIVGDSNDAKVFEYNPGTLSEVNLSTGLDAAYITGVICWFHPVHSQSLNYGPANTERVVYVCDDPDVIFEVQDDGTGALTADTVGLNASLAAGAGGSTYTGQSGYVLDGGGVTAPASDISQPLLILGLANREGNELSDYAVWEVLINNHSYNRPVAGVA